MDKLQIKEEDYCKEVIKLKRVLEGSFLVMAEMLYKIREDRLWEKSGFTSLDEFSVDLKMSPASISKLISVYETYVLKFKIPEQKLLTSSGWSTLYSIIKYAKDRDSALELIDKSSVLTRSDFISSLEKEKIKPHTHEWNEIHFRQCKVCGERERIYKD